ncbi:hydroxyethylthiazole kinase [Microcella alkalica]|uniref:Hydroxyethylthiazole kinase n=1 Tax=Microcella alkalica TaxID=355930 RepID=A0A839E9R1_9MICO|nr:hydroxyethylthiazole kinase [Microcella alkalica]MBA8846498.1 hydroxyethylthiazole kinase [Microcella alkalica]
MSAVVASATSADAASTVVPADDVADRLELVRESAPLVQCLTNVVVANATANILLALGAAPAMVDIPEEAGLFAGVASAVLVNLGTPHAEQRAAMEHAVRSASTAGTPWVLDPVAVGALPVRTALARKLAAARPTAIRGNASEIMALAGVGAGGRGVDATDSVDAAAEAAEALARRFGAVVAVSGAVDLVTDGERTVLVRTGHARLTTMTGGGCALGAVMAAFLAAGGDPLVAVVAASAVYTIAAEIAAERSAGPGSFAPAFLDALAGIDGEGVRARALLA